MSPLAHKRRFSVLTVLLSGFVATSVLGVGLALYLGLGTAYQNTRNLWVLIASNDLNSLERVMHDRMSSVQTRARWVQKEVAKGVLDPEFPYGWQNAMRAMASDQMNVLAYGIVGPDRKFRGYTPENMESITRPIPAEDMPVSNITSLQNVTGDRTVFPRWYPFFGQPVVMDWIPLYRDGHYLGLFVQYLSLSNISRSLTRGRENTPGVPFVIVAGNHVLAHPLLRSWGNQVASAIADSRDISRSPIPLPTTTDLGDPVLANIGQSEKLDYPVTQENRNIGNIQISGLDVNGHYSVIVSKQLDDTPFSPLVIGMHFKASLFDAEYDRLILSSVLGGVLLLISGIVAVYISRHFTRPIRRFAVAARGLEAGKLGELPQLQGSRIREYDDAARSFNHMVTALRDRERITSLFGKFLPASIARELLASGTDSGVLPPQLRTATVLFVDIAGFTSLCEDLEPDRIVAMLNAYFDTLTAIIEDHGGIITQFQGDAILAVYNAFDDLHDHADAALDTAIEIQRTVKTRDFDGQKLRCRCGINTGPMVAGNVGASDRLSFTVHGDAVNSAARLEAENKNLGTDILLSQSTRDLLSEPERVHIAGNILLRGRSSQTAVYTATRSVRQDPHPARQTTPGK